MHPDDETRELPLDTVEMRPPGDQHFHTSRNDATTQAITGSMIAVMAAASICIAAGLHEGLLLGASAILLVFGIGMVVSDDA